MKSKENVCSLEQVILDLALICPLGDSVEACSEWRYGCQASTAGIWCASERGTFILAGSGLSGDSERAAAGQEQVSSEDGTDPSCLRHRAEASLSSPDIWQRLSSAARTPPRSWDLSRQPLRPSPAPSVPLPAHSPTQHQATHLSGLYTKPLLIPVDIRFAAPSNDRRKLVGALATKGRSGGALGTGGREQVRAGNTADLDAGGTEEAQRGQRGL